MSASLPSAVCSGSFPVQAGQIVAAAAGLAAPLSLVAPMGLTPLFVLASLGVLVVAIRTRTWPALARPLTLVFALFLVWAAASLTWSLSVRHGLDSWPRIASMAACGVFLIAAVDGLDRTARALVAKWLAVGVALALVLLLIEYLTLVGFGRSLWSLFYFHQPYRLQIFNRGSAVIALLLWPAGVWAWRRFGAPAAIALALGALVLLSQFESLAAALAIALGMAVFALARFGTRLAAALVASVLVVGTIAAPLLPRVPVVAELAQQHDLSNSVFHRLDIWRFTADQIALRPVLGAGLNTARSLNGGLAVEGTRLERMPLHPHNAMLQLWLELGAVGAALGAALLALAAWGTLRLGPARVEPAAGLALVAAAATVAATGYGIWQEWWMAALWLAAVAMRAVGAPVSAAPP